VAHGMTHDAARRAALLRGGRSRSGQGRCTGRRESGTASRPPSATPGTHGRGLRRAPGFAGRGSLTLGLGIGATTAILQPGERRCSSRTCRSATLTAGAGLERRDVRGIRPRAALLPPSCTTCVSGPPSSKAFGGSWANTTVLTDRDPEQIRIGLVTANFFTLLGASPALGRVFRLDDDEEGAAPAILSE
jgi:hypothetical protein